MPIKLAWELRRTAADRKASPGLPWQDQMKIMRRVLPLIWPKGEPNIKLRVVACAILVIAGKVISVTMPLLWRGVMLCVARFSIDTMFGCASLPGTDADPAAPGI